MKRILFLSIIFGLIASLSLYFVLFLEPEPQQTTAASSEETKEKELEGEKEIASVESKATENQSAENTTTRELLSISEGKRAISLLVDDVIGVSGFIKAGAFVDVVSVIRPPEEAKAQGQHEAATLLLQNVKVLGIGHGADSDAEAARYETVTLEVTTREAMALSFVKKGEITLLLREDGDAQMEPEHTHLHEDELHKGVYRK